MPNRQPFGRRRVANASYHPAAHAHVHARPAVMQPGASNPTDWSTADPELDAWRQARTSPWSHLPWRQITLIASLCFGVASLVLPASVNRAVNWILYALMAGGLVAGIRMRKAEAAGGSIARKTGFPLARERQAKNNT